MKITILSGGSGNDALVKGLTKMFGKDTDIKVVVNAYDAGKSTGVCREITGTLGVSDIRKNHVRLLKALNPEYNRTYAEFLESRYDLTKGHECEEVKSKLEAWGLDALCCYADSFFARQEAKEHEFKDFCIGNIIYAEMFSELGYEATNKKMSELIGFPDCVLANDFNNTYIKAVTKNGRRLDEGEIVELSDGDDEIVGIEYTTGLNGPKLSVSEQKDHLNELAIEAVEDADFIVISTGTFWSSIYPTLEFGEFYKYINKSKAKKVWAMNTIEDKDSFGFGTKKFIDTVRQLGLDLSDFTILLNKDASPLLKERTNTEKFVEYAMGNNNGKHCPDKFAKGVVKTYFGIDYSLSDFDRIYVDFDDTIWSRDPELEAVSKRNTKALNNLSLTNNIKIVSGNTYESIAKKLYKVYGTNLEGCALDIWADCATTKYVSGRPTMSVSDVEIDNAEEIKDKLEKLIEFSDTATITYMTNGFGKTIGVKVKGLRDTERKLLHILLKNSSDFKDVDPKITGKTTIDITKKGIDKTVILSYDGVNILSNGFTDKKTLYIGDELDSGNDKEISSVCHRRLYTSSPKDTEIYLELLREN